MLTYITIFVVCVILAVVIRFVFKAISESSRSLSTSKTQVELIHSTPANKKAKAARNTATGTATRSVREPQHATSVGTSSHCSLYDASSAEPKENHNQNVGWPYREEKPASGGRTYKVTRKVATTRRVAAKTPKVAAKTPRHGAIVKPWGW